MKQRVSVLLGGLLMISGLGLFRLRAQDATAPQAYSYTQDPALSIMGPTIVKLSRDGPKELVDQIIPAGPGRDKEFHNRVLYDFQAHKIYTRIVSDASVPCSVMDYTSPAAPPEFDMISGAADLMKEMGADKDQSKQVGTETVNGLAAKVMEVNSAQGKGKVWVAVKGNFPIKIVSIAPDGNVLTVIEMKQLSFAKPPASTFNLPEGCTAIQGEASAHGVHAETGPGASAAKPTANITTLTLQSIPNYKGPCPAHIKMAGTITTDGPGTVFYQFGAGKFDPGETVTFSVAGTKSVTHVMAFTPAFGNSMGGSAILQAIVEDAQGNHGMLTQGSNNADFSITCTSGGGQ